MFDWFWRSLGYVLKKDDRKEYVDRKIKEEEDRKTFNRVAKETPSFSRCAILQERSQKQKAQQQSYAVAVASHVDNALPTPTSPIVPARVSKRIKRKKDTFI